MRQIRNSANERGWLGMQTHIRVSRSHRLYCGYLRLGLWIDAAWLDIWRVIARQTMFIAPSMWIIFYPWALLNFQIYMACDRWVWSPRWWQEDSMLAKSNIAEPWYQIKIHRTVLSSSNRFFDRKFKHTKLWGAWRDFHKPMTELMMSNKQTPLLDIAPDSSVWPAMIFIVGFAS